MEGGGCGRWEGEGVGGWAMCEGREGVRGKSTPGKGFAATTATSCNTCVVAVADPGSKPTTCSNREWSLPRGLRT